MRDCDIFSGFVIDFCARDFGKKIWDVLDERSGAKDVETLQAVADSEYGQASGVGGVKQKAVDRISARVGGGGVRRAWCVEAGGIDVGLAAGQKHALRALDHLFHFVWSLIERNANRFAAGQRDGALVLRDRALGVFAVNRCGMGMAIRGGMLFQSKSVQPILSMADRVLF